MTFFGRLSRRYPTIGLGWSIISAFMTGAWCLPVDAGILMEGRRLIRRLIWRKHMNLAKISITIELQAAFIGQLIQFYESNDMTEIRQFLWKR